MDSLDVPAAPAALTPIIGNERPPRIWKFWGTALWGLFVFAAMFVGQIGVVAWFVLQRGGPIDIAAAVHVIGGGLTISLSVIMGLPAVLAALWIAIRISRTPFADYLALRWPSWTDLATGAVALIVLVMGWDLLSRAAGREIVPGFMGEVLNSRGIFCARLSLPRLVGIVSRPGWRHRPVVAGVDRAASAIRLVLFRRSVFDRPAARLSALSL
jgi:hypothetical protein